MKNLIADCRFWLDFVWITIVSPAPAKIVSQLSRYLSVVRVANEARTRNPIFPEKFRKRTYFRRPGFGKLYLIHEAMEALQGTSGMLIAHDLSLVEALTLSKILKTVPAISDFHFCCVEFAWIYQPPLSVRVEYLQRMVSQHLHIMNSREASNKISQSGLTYYIGPRGRNLQVKNYIVPKGLPNSPIRWVKVELTVRTRYLRRMNLTKPEDFFGLTPERLTQSIAWLDLRLESVRSNQLNLVTGGLWRARLINDWKYLGMSEVITTRRKEKLCPPRCPHKGGSKCALLSALNRHTVAFSYGIFDAIQTCEFAVSQAKFADQHTTRSKYGSMFESHMKTAYQNWNRPPISPVAPTQVPKKSKGKKRTSTKAKHRKRVNYPMLPEALRDDKTRTN